MRLIPREQKFFQMFADVASNLTKGATLLVDILKNPSGDPARIGQLQEIEHRGDEMTHAIIEACINAREHSGSVDNRIYVRCLGVASSDGTPRIDVWISDHGRGFDLSEARTRRRTLGPAHKRGWGLQIIEAHMDEVDITSTADGTTIHMVKYGKTS